MAADGEAAGPELQDKQADSEAPQAELQSQAADGEASQPELQCQAAGSDAPGEAPPPTAESSPPLILIKPDLESGESPGATPPVVAEPSPPLLINKLDVGQRARGIVRTYDPIQGIGCIRCEGLRGCSDVVLERAEAEKCEISVGAHVTFAVRRNDGCRPYAVDLRVLLKGTPQREFVRKLAGQSADIDWRKRYVGIIKWLRHEKGLPASMRAKDPGWGYIACRDTFKMFECDVWAYPVQLQGFKVGDAVSFRVSIDHWYSWPIALDVKAAPRPLEDREVSARGAAAGGAAIETSDAEKPARSDDDPPTGDEQEEGSAAGNAAATAGRKEKRPVPADAPKEGEDAPWQRFSQPDGRGYWWWCSFNGDCFLEDSPAPWAKFSDPETGRQYWWKNDDEWFWAS